MKRLGSIILALVALGASANAAPPTEPVVKHLGRTVVGYRDGLIRIVLGYRWADQTFAKASWIFLEAGVTSAGNKPVEINREDVSLLAPDGTRIPLPSQKRMAEGIPDLQWMLQKAQVSRDPIDGYFSSATKFQRIGLFAVPGSEVTFDQFSVAPNLLAQGDLYFEAPKGTFAAGTYTFVVKNKDLDVKIPFKLPAESLKKAEAEDKAKSVSW